MGFKPIVRVPGHFAGTVKGRSDRIATGDILEIHRIGPSDLLRVWQAKAIIVRRQTIPPHIGVLMRMCGIPILLSNGIESLIGKTIALNGSNGDFTLTDGNSVSQDTVIPRWKAEYDKRSWQVSACDHKQVAALSKAACPITFFLRHELLWVGSTFNPFACIENGEEAVLEDRLYEALKPFAIAISGTTHRLHFRSIDARSDEFENLQPSSPQDKSSHGLALTLEYPTLLQVEKKVCLRLVAEFGLQTIYSFPYVGVVDELRSALQIVSKESKGLTFGVFVETPAFAQEIQSGQHLGLEVFIGTKDLASLFCGYIRGVGDSDYKNPLVSHPQFKLLVTKIAATARVSRKRCYYFCFLEHFEESMQLLPESIGFSLCAHEFSVLTGFQIPAIHGITDGQELMSQ
jgi:hypothetical protein